MIGVPIPSAEDFKLTTKMVKTAMTIPTTIIEVPPPGMVLMPLGQDDSKKQKWRRVSQRINFFVRNELEISRLARSWGGEDVLSKSIEKTLKTAMFMGWFYRVQGLILVRPGGQFDARPGVKHVSRGWKIVMSRGNISSTPMNGFFLEEPNVRWLKMNSHRTSTMHIGPTLW